MQSRALFSVVGLLVAVAPVTDSSAQCADETFKLLASNGTSDDSARFAVALHGTTALNQLAHLVEPSLLFKRAASAARADPRVP